MAVGQHVSAVNAILTWLKVFKFIDFHPAMGIVRGATQTDTGVQGAHLNPLGRFLCTSTPFIWRILRACRPF